MSTDHAPARLLRRRPETEGVDPTGVLGFLDAVDRDLGGLHGFMLLRHGRVVAEGAWQPYHAEQPHMLFSLSKSFTSTGIGLAVAEGRLTVDDAVLSFFPDDAPAAICANLAAMRVRHLLSMSTGHAADTTGALRQHPDGNWVRAFLAQPVEHEPGTHFLYNSGASYMLSAIVHRVTGQDLLDYLQPRLLAPLGIVGATWERCPRGLSTGGWGLRITTEDIARFGQLYLQRGHWRGRRLLPEAWIAEATSRQVANGQRPDSDWEQGYGYQFWRCRHGIYRGDGAFGQYCVVMPEQEAVLAITAGLGNMQAVLNLVWEHLLPAMRPARLPADPTAHRRLATAVSGLALATVAGSAASPLAATLVGRTYAFEPAPQAPAAVAFAEFAAHACTVVLRNAQGEHPLTAGYQHWLPGTTTIDSPTELPVAASYAWTAPDTLELRVCVLGTPFVRTITCRFADSQLTLRQRLNVSFGPVEGPELTGRLQ